MTMKTIKVSEATELQLDWLVAKCEGVNEEAFHLFYEPTDPVDYDSHGYPEFHYSTVWAQGGPLVDKYLYCVPTYDSRFNSWFANEQSPAEYGKQTFLQALLRAIVKLKLGDEVEVPDELI